MKILKTLFYRIKMLLMNPINGVVLLGLPLATALIIQLIFNTSQGDFRIPVGIIDLDKSEYSTVVVNRVKDKPTINVHVMEDLKTAEKWVSSGKLEALYVLKKDFMKNILEDEIEGIIQIIKSPSSMSAEAIGEQVSSEVIRLSSNVTAAEDVIKEYKKRKLIISDTQKNELWEKVWKQADSYWEPKPLMTTNYQEFGDADMQQGDSQPADQKGKKVPPLIYGTIIAYLMFSMLIAGSWLIEEKNNGILKRIYSTPFSLIQYIVISIFAVSLINFIWILLMLYGLKYYMGFADIAIMDMALLMFVYIIAASALSVLIACCMKKTSQLQIGAPLIALVTSFLGGCFANLNEVSSRFKIFAYFTPQYWFNEGVSKLNIGGTINSAIFEIGVLLLISVIMLILGNVILNIGLYNRRATD